MGGITIVRLKTNEALVKKQSCLRRRLRLGRRLRPRLRGKEEEGGEGGFSHWLTKSEGNRVQMFEKKEAISSDGRK